MTEIEISVVVPTFNRPESLKKTIESLCNQTYPHEKYEVLICDDSFTEESYTLVKSYAGTSDTTIKYFKANSKTKGPANARNVGILNASGKIVGFTDDDCTVEKDWLETANKAFTKNPKICGIYGTVTTIGECKKEKYTISRKVDVNKDDGSYVTPNVFYKKDILQKVGCFDVTQRYLEDIELGWRVETIGEILFVPTLKVNHKILCLSLQEYLSRLKVIEYWVMMHSKHPNHIEKNRYVHKRIQSLRPLYISLSLLSIISLIDFGHITYILIGITLALYSLQNIFIDKKFSKYPFRLLKFPLTYLLDMIKLYYSIKASIKYRYWIFY
jgi:glycosyltransferase involved in cell wall biosynthesis